MEEKQSETMNVWVRMPDGKREIMKDVMLAIIVRTTHEEEGVCSEVRMHRVNLEDNNLGIEEDALCQRHFAAHIALSTWIARNVHGGDIFMTKAEEIRCSGALDGKLKNLDHRPTEEDWERFKGEEGEDE